MMILTYSDYLKSMGAKEKVYKLELCGISFGGFLGWDLQECQGHHWSNLDVT